MHELTAEKNDDALSLAAVGVAAYLVANVVHECLGHGLTSLAVGARISVLTSVFFHSTPGSRMTDAGGPTANLLAGLLLWAWLRRRPTPPAAQAFVRFALLLITVFNLTWAAGCFCQTGVSGHGDWSFVIAGLTPAGLWRSGAGLAGFALYWLALRTLGRGLDTFVGPAEAHRGRRLFRLIAWPYLGAGAAACVAAALDRTGGAAALKGAALESLALNAPLLLVPWFTRGAAAGAPGEPILRYTAGLALIAGVFVTYALTLGHGLRF